MCRLYPYKSFVYINIFSLLVGTNFHMRPSTWQ